MKARILLPFLALAGLILLVGLACGTTTGTPTQAPPTQQPTIQSGQYTPAPVSGEGSVNNIQDVQKATIQIESEGTFEDPQEGLVVNGAGRGSGFIIDPSGIAVTNNHVVTGSALIKVWVNGESTPRNARILGVSECSDLAVIDIDGDGYPYMTWYGQQPQVGMEVYTAGFPLGEPEYSLTKGIISKLRADGETSWASLDHVLAHDATINPGSSGGPLVTGDGQVVGINYSSIKTADQYFAIDASTAKPIVDQLQTGVDIDSIGINGTAFITEDGSVSGIWLSSVKSGSPADKTQMKAGDILLQMEGLVLATDGTLKDYCSILRTHKPSDTLSVKVYRYSTGEILEGQLNGRTMVVTQPGSTSAESTPSTTLDAPAYFTEEFDGEIPDWTYFVQHGDETKMDLHTDNGALVFNLTGEDLYVYLLYDPYTYTDVRIDARAANRGFNTNNVSLICRYDPDYGWYEFAIGNDGLYTIYAYDRTTQRYETLFNGGSTAIHSGKDVNEYTAICKGNTLALYINGVEARTFTEKRFAFRDGQVGISTSSFNVLPIIVEWDWVTIIEP
jgi:S1-C subfamily serine protease